MTKDLENIRFNVLRNALYHTGRRRSLERWNRVFNLLVVLLGTAAVGEVALGIGVPQHWIGALVAAIGAVQLVFDFGRQARDHQVLQREYFALLADIEETITPDEELCAKWYGRMIRITGDEPPMLRFLDAKAYNDAVDATYGADSLERLSIPWYHPIVGRFMALEGYHYRKLSELDQPAA